MAITNWQNLEKIVMGPEFEAGGWKWRILLFPSSNNNQDTISIYLDFVDPEGAPVGWHSCVQFALVLWNPEVPAQFIYQCAHHRFTAEKPNWGFTQYYNLNELFTHCENQTQALIENGSTNITAFVQVIYKIPTEGDEPTKSVPLALQRIFYNLQISDTQVETIELTKSFGWDLFNSFINHDVHEFNRMLQDILKVKMKNTRVDGEITRLFVGKVKKYVKCISVNYKYCNVEDYYDIQLNIKGCKTLRDSFKNFVQEVTLEGNNKYQTEGYGLQVSYLKAFLQFYIYNLKYSNIICKKMQLLRLNIVMNIRLEEFLSKDADRSISHKYILFGVLAHSGSFYEGHYFSLLKPEKDGSWFRFDDTCITSVIDDEVFANAYILVYIRESDINEMLSPVALEEIPYHLRCLEEERTLAYQKEKEMLTVKIMTSETFKNYQGFGLANFNEVHVYKILKSETFGVFKENISKVLNIPPKQARFWIFINRPNGTIRPEYPILEPYLNISMEDIHKSITSNQDEMKLYMEVSDKPINGELWLSEENDHLIVFLKYFDPDKQAFEGLGHLYVQKFNKVGDYTQVFCEKKELPPRTPLEIYEEIKPYRIIKMNPEYTFQESDMQDGDIFVSKRIQKHKVARRCWNIPDFHESLIIVSFKPKFKNQEPSLKFDLVLGEKWTYDMIAEAVATRLSVNTFKLRFTTAFSTTGIPKSIIKRSINQTLSDMLKIAYLKPSIYVLYYEILDINIVELETQRSLEVSWLGNTVKEKQVICIHLQKNAIINELLKEILKKVSLSSPNSRIRLFEVRHNKIHKDYTGTESIGSIQEFATLYAEEIPLDEIAINQYDRIFKGEKFVDTKVRLQQRLDMNEKGFSKVKFAIIHGTTSYIKPKYFDDEKKKLSNDDYLGLDYTNELVEFEMQNLLI
ncbi:hypothetical protein RclHR1_01630018 [Rhizophagus clarus]|uniref:ubiquitinyl hydrolase 1 n=1 Tax=Rhizophagus clarus TaxID=94130 RepID=A0A2Z6QHD0_9GLOM|nr:hypothetical protein RclHR1_01630018 [Rhizophagus clarus]